MRQKPRPVDVRLLNKGWNSYSHQPNPYTVVNGATLTGRAASCPPHKFHSGNARQLSQNGTAYRERRIRREQGPWTGPLDLLMYLRIDLGPYNIIFSRRLAVTSELMSDFDGLRYGPPRTLTYTCQAKSWGKSLKHSGALTEDFVRPTSRFTILLGNKAAARDAETPKCECRTGPSSVIGPSTRPLVERSTVQGPRSTVYGPLALLPGGSDSLGLPFSLGLPLTAPVTPVYTGMNHDGQPYSPGQDFI
ncbi:hypothetical protein FB451DRAFT_1177770 [Mycena latifolia]|nr:hypothetical protein FB451DRAFT_1177770 [Mycena latifolia]